MALRTARKGGSRNGGRLFLSYDIRVLRQDVADLNGTEHEQCGILVYDQKVRFIELPNIHKDPADCFALSTHDVLNCVQGNTRLIGYLHTHLPFHDPYPSQSDIDGIPHSVIGAVFSPSEDKFSWYTHRGVWRTTTLEAAKLPLFLPGR